MKLFGKLANVFTHTSWKFIAGMMMGHLVFVLVANSGLVNI